MRKGVIGKLVIGDWGVSLQNCTENMPFFLITKLQVTNHQLLYICTLVQLPFSKDELLK